MTLTSYMFMLKDGYVGVSTAVEIGYAHAKGKIIVSSEEIEDFGIRVFVDKVMNVAKLTDYLKEEKNV